MPESPELKALRRYMDSSGVPHRVTSTTSGVHASTSYHYRKGTNGDGLAMVRWPELVTIWPMSYTPIVRTTLKTEGG